MSVKANPFFNDIHGRFGFGCMRLPMQGEQVDSAEFTRMVDAFLDAGFNYFDTAHGYLGGKSEIALRECLISRYPRDRYILTNKLSTHHFNRNEEIRPLFESQLKACGVDYFDFYLMHAQSGISMRSTSGAAPMRPRSSFWPRAESAISASRSTTRRRCWSRF